MAVLRLGETVKPINQEQANVASVVGLRQSEPLIQRPGNRPEGVEGSNKVEAKGLVDLRLGLISTDRGEDPLGEEGRTSPGLPYQPSYINTVCLATERFSGRNCWVASWGTNLERQREVDLPILST